MARITLALISAVGFLAIFGFATVSTDLTWWSEHKGFQAEHKDDQGFHGAK
jgi:hypothetical protein